VVTFDGEFVGGGLPSESTKAIPLGGFDLSFLLTARVSEVIKGELPDGWSTEVVFAVHSPAILFGVQGAPLRDGQHVPEGQHRITLWRGTNGGYDLEVAPIP
jgi:hypothetical protein